MWKNSVEVAFLWLIHVKAKIPDFHLILSRLAVQYFVNLLRSWGDKFNFKLNYFTLCLQFEIEKEFFVSR